MKKNFFESLDKAEMLISYLKPGSDASSNVALQLIDTIDAEQLTRPWQIETQMVFANCQLQNNVPRTIATQCLIYLYDPGNGWIRDSRKRGDMLIMTAKLVEKGLSLQGFTYYKDTILDLVQQLINWRNMDPSATLNNEIVEIFNKAGYDFSYPDLDNQLTFGNCG